ncbi:hypothetical protein BST91_03425 [Nonlabens tegetincola]|uniref:hypothetical protein n=1 Tax=Nonlabens tegetincola TaxID=323273 RepID=UPI000A20518E|nr:hypothetical protein [Nonlabens tegetincola]ARN70765.1 hypothetical protein BST91_03425 [Nonlabens tegetincola]
MNKKNYTLFLNLAFIGIGGYKLYQHFIDGIELPTYQIVLAGFLVLMGVYQLIMLNRNFKKPE